VDELEHKLKEWEELDDLRHDRELAGLVTRESSLNNREDTLMAEWMDLEDARVRLLARELTTDIRESGLNSKAAELAEKEKQVVERHMQEMATAQKRLEEL
jgi:exonuclease VII large subunit